MTEKLSFSIEDAQIINENPDSNFAVLSLDFFASGENLHDMYVSEDTLMRTSESIKNCPLVWKYDEQLDDVYTHDKDEVPCGFVPESSKIESRKLNDGRTMLSVMAYVWKRYTGELLGFFKRDGGKKPVSVEMSVLDSKVLSNGMTELLDFKYEGITVLGSFVTPAIPLANATVLSFSQMKNDYEQDFRKEFEKIITFPYKSIKDANPALKGIKPKITVEQANQIARQADTIGTSETKNGWAIAISSFKKTHEVKDGRWVKKEEKMTEIEFKVSDSNKSTEEKAMEEEKKEEMAQVEEMQMPTMPMAAEPPKENPSEEKLSPEQLKELREEKKEEGKKFGFPAKMSMEKMAAIFAEEDEEEEIGKAKIECAKGEFADPEIMMAGMYAKMCKMAETVTKMAEINKAYMAENEELKQFKAGLEQQQKDFEVKKTLEELAAKVQLPSEAKEEMAVEAEKYSFSNLDNWKTYCKAKSFEFAIKETGKSDVVRVGMPFTGSTQKKNEELWG